MKIRSGRVRVSVWEETNKLEQKNISEASKYNTDTMAIGENLLYIQRELQNKMRNDNGAKNAEKVF